MFEAGKWYQITMMEGGEEGYSTYQVLDYQHPLLKLRHVAAGEQIVNVNSPMFIRAQLSAHQGEPERLVLELPEWATKSD
jgi:hypothetical protein